MVAIPTHRRKLTPSARVGGAIIPTDVAQRGAGTEAEGLAAIGRGISTLGRFRFRIKADQVALNDAVANIKAGAITDATNIEVLGVRGSLENKFDDKGTSEYERSANDIFNRNFEKIGKLNMSDRQREITVAKWEADRGIAISRARYASVDDTIKTGKASLELLVKEAVITGDPQKIADAEEMRAEMAPIIWADDKVADAEIARWRREAEIEKHILENYQKAKANEILEAQREIDRDFLGTELDKGTITYSKIDATSLSEKEQESYRLKMIADSERRAKGIALEPDYDEKARLEGMAWGISSGQTDIKEYEKQVEEAFREDSFDGMIRNELLSFGRGKYAPYFANAMNTRENYAYSQLVTLPREEAFEEMILRLTSKADKEAAQTLRQLQKENVDRYNAALREWFERPENKNPSSGKIREVSLEILVDYRLTPEQLRERKKEETTKTFALPAPFGGRTEPIVGEFGLRPDQTKKGKGFLGPLRIKGGGVATEYSVGVKLEANNGKETNIPTLIPTLTEKEIDIMVNDIIPNKKSVPKAILQKAVDHANKRVRAGKSPFAESPISPTAKPPSNPPPKDRAYIGFTVLQDGTNIKWIWDGTKWQRAQ